MSTTKSSGTAAHTNPSTAAAPIRRRRPIGLDNPSLLNPGRNPATGGGNGGAQGGGAPNIRDAMSPALMLISIFLLSFIPRLVFGVPGSVPLESMLPVKFALGNALVEGTQSYTVASGLWLDAIVCAVVAFFTAPTGAILDFLALVGVVVASFPSQLAGSFTKYIAVSLMFAIACFQAHARQIPPWELWKTPDTNGSAVEARPILWTLGSAAAVGLCIARCLRWSSMYTNVRLGFSSTISTAVSKVVKTLGQVPLVAALVRILFSPFIAVAQSVGLKWPLALALWLTSMVFQWTTHVSEGGILIFVSFVIGLLTTLLEDRRSGALGAKLGFTAVVCAVNFVVWLISPPRALPFLANAVVAAYLILYVSYLRTPSSNSAPAAKSAPQAGNTRSSSAAAGKKDNNKGKKEGTPTPEPTTPLSASGSQQQQQQVEIYTSLSTVVLMLLWLAMLGLDLTQQVASGWPVPTTYNLFLHVNTIGYGMVMLVTALFDLVHKELHEGHAARLQREKVEALSNTLKNSTQNNTKIVITKGKKSATADNKTPVVEKEDSDGGEAPAPSNSNTPLNSNGTPIPENNSSSSSFAGSNKQDDDGDNITRGQSNHSIAPSSTPPTTASSEPASTPSLQSEPEETTTKVNKNVVTAPAAIGGGGGSRGESPVQSSTPATGNSFDSSSAPSNPASTTAPTAATKDKKKSKAEIEREKKEWQEAQLRAELGDSLEEKKEKTKSTTPSVGAVSGKKDTKKTVAKESPVTPRGGKSDDQLAALRAAAVKEQELKERLEAERRERERKLQEEQQKKEKERERQEAVRQKELEKKNKEALEAQKKKEKELEAQREKEAKLRQEEKVRKDKEKLERQAAKEAKAKKDEEDAKKAALAAAIAKASEDSLPGSTAPAGPPPADAVNLRAPVAGKSMAETLRERQKAAATVDSSSPVKSAPQVVEAKAPVKGEATTKKVTTKTTAAAPKQRFETPTTPLTPTQYPAATSKGPPMAICSVDDLSGSPTEALAVPLPRSSQARRQQQQVPVSPNGGGAPLPPSACDDEDENFGLGGVGGGTSRSGASALLPMAIDADPEPAAVNFTTPPMVAADLGSHGGFTPLGGPAESNSSAALPAAMLGTGPLLKSTPPVGVFSEDDAETTPVYRSPNSKTEAAGHHRQQTPPDEDTSAAGLGGSNQMSANDRHDYLFALLGGGGGGDGIAAAQQPIEDDNNDRSAVAPTSTAQQDSAGSFTVTSSNAPASSNPAMEMGSPIFGGGAGLIGNAPTAAGSGVAPTSSADDEDFWTTLNQGVSGLLAESGNSGVNPFASNSAQAGLRDSPPPIGGGAAPLFGGGGATATGTNDNNPFGTAGAPLLSMGNATTTAADNAGQQQQQQQQQTFQVVGSNGQILQYAAPAGSNQQFFVAQAAVGQNGQPMYYIPQTAAAGYTAQGGNTAAPMFVLQQPAGNVAPPPPPPPASTSPSNAATNAYQTMTMPPQYTAPSSGGSSPQHPHKS